MESTTLIFKRGDLKRVTLKESDAFFAEISIRTFEVSRDLRHHLAVFKAPANIALHSHGYRMQFSH